MSANECCVTLDCSIRPGALMGPRASRSQPAHYHGRQGVISHRAGSDAPASQPASQSAAKRVGARRKPPACSGSLRAAN